MFEEIYLMLFLVGLVPILVSILIHFFTQPSPSPCIYCGTMLPADKGIYITRYSTGQKEHVCEDCFQKEVLDKQGLCPHCNKPMVVGEDSFTQSIIDNKWYHTTCLRRIELLSKQQPVEKMITKEVIVKVRCPYCSNLYDETLDKCPHCGAKHT